MNNVWKNSVAFVIDDQVISTVYSNTVFNLQLLHDISLKLKRNETGLQL